jgi:hypothetical protein
MQEMGKGIWIFKTYMTYTREINVTWLKYLLELPMYANEVSCLEFSHFQFDVLKS